MKNKEAEIAGMARKIPDHIQKEANWTFKNLIKPKKKDHWGSFHNDEKKGVYAGKNYEDADF